jgi:hypothetical protein
MLRAGKRNAAFLKNTPETAGGARFARPLTAQIDVQLFSLVFSP